MILILVFEYTCNRANPPDELAHEYEDVRALVRQHVLGLTQRRLHALHAAQRVQIRFLRPVLVEPQLGLDNKQINKQMKNERMRRLCRDIAVVAIWVVTYLGECEQTSSTD